jgi:putative DNA primase/helicase
LSKPDLSPIGGDESRQVQAPKVKIIVPAVEPVAWPKHKEEVDEKTGKRKAFKLPLPPPKVWEYRLGDGSLFGVVARWEADERRATKIVLPCVYAEIDGEQRWSWSGFGDAEGSRPLLGLMELMAKPLAPVLLVEGEKTRDAAPRWMPDSWVCVTWQGGGKAWQKADWLPLVGRRVVIWPDKDSAPIDPKTGQIQVDPRTKRPKLPPGEQTARDLFVHLSSIGAGVAQVPVYGPRMGMLPSNGWDLADPVPEGFDPTEWMVRAEQQIVMPEARVESPLPVEAPAPKQRQDDAEDWNGNSRKRGGDADGIDRKAEYRCVGYSQSGGQPVYHIFAARSGFIVTLSAKQICERAGLYSVMPDDNFWREHMDLPRDKFEKLPWAHIGKILINKCLDAGYFSIENERGRGVWLDDGRVVVHLGQTLVVNGRVVNPAKMESEYYYPVRQRLIQIKQLPPLSDAEGKLLRSIFRHLRWENPFFAELMGGWIGMAPIAGAMPFRTHFWMTGPAGSGKTWIIENIVAPCFGQIAYRPLGNSSAAGIMGVLGRDSRPVIFDEAEGKGEEGRRRRDMIIELMRYSSSQSEGKVVKGTSSHGTVQFSLNSPYFLSSIGVGLQEMADLTRTVVAKLRASHGEDSSFAQLKSLVAQLPKDLPERLLRRQINQVEIVRENAETFARVISLQMGNRRLGDMIGTLMAGDHSLVSGRVLTFDQAEERVRDRIGDGRVDDFNSIKSATEDVDLLEHLASYVVRVQNRFGVPLDRPIGELMLLASNLGEDDKIAMGDAQNILRRIGLLYDFREGVGDGFWIGTQKTYVATEVMRRSAYAQGWQLILGRHKAAIKSTEARNFGGFRVPGIWLPIKVLTGDDSDLPILKDIED